jgi:hypothetical protein
MVCECVNPQARRALVFHTLSFLTHLHGYKYMGRGENPLNQIIGSDADVDAHDDLTGEDGPESEREGEEEEDEQRQQQQQDEDDMGDQMPRGEELEEEEDGQGEHAGAYMLFLWWWW